MREKIFKISQNVICAVAGITADANVLVSKLRAMAAGFRSSYEDDIPIEQLVSLLADFKQRYTQVGGLVLKFMIGYFSLNRIKTGVHAPLWISFWLLPLSLYRPGMSLVTRTPYFFLTRIRFEENFEDRPEFFNL